MNYDNNVCPRCLGGIPNNMMPGEYIGALSRADNKTEICSECGQEEAFLGIWPVQAWPIIWIDSPQTERARNRFLERRQFELINLKGNHE